MGVREAQTLDFAHMPQFVRTTHAEGSAAPGSASSTSTPLLNRADSGTGSDDSQSELMTEWAKRKAQFFAHFKALSDGDKSAESPPESAAPAAPEPHAESKCHVCNVALRLLRLRVRPAPD